MNDGVVTLVIQWCFICLIWMGSLDRPLSRFSFSRRRALAVLSVCLVCSMVSWRLYFLPIEVNISGGILPLLLAGWMYAHLPEEKRRYLLISSFFLGFMLFFLRKILFWDPVLLVMDEMLLLPVVIVPAAIVVARNIVLQAFILLVSLPLSDTLFTLSQLGQAGSAKIGSEDAQDMLWVSLALWLLVISMWRLVEKGAIGLGGKWQPLSKWKAKKDTDR